MKFKSFAPIIVTTLLFSAVVVAQVGYSNNIGTNTGGGGGGAGAGNCAVGQVVTGLNAGSGPTCSNTIAAGTLTTSNPFAFSQTWNNAAVTFKGFNLTYTRTAKADDSGLFNVIDGVNSNTLFSVRNDAVNTFGGAQLILNNGGALSANSQDVSFHSVAGGLAIGTGDGAAGTRSIYAGRITLGENWVAGTIQTELNSTHLLLNADSVARWSSNSGNAAAVDTGLSRISTGVLAAGNAFQGDFSGSFVSTLVQTKTILTVATLPTCNGAAEGTHASVNNALGPVAFATVVGGGAVHISVYCNGTNWIVQ